jgi:hypothetical protein
MEENTTPENQNEELTKRLKKTSKKKYQRLI